MDHDFAVAVAKEAIRELQEIGNFNEFRDDRESDGINSQCAGVIAQAVMGEFDRRAEIKMLGLTEEQNDCVKQEGL